MESIYRSNTLCVSSKFPNLQNSLPPQKNLGGEGASDTCRQVPLLVNFFKNPTFRVWCLYRYLVHGKEKLKFLSDTASFWQQIFPREKANEVYSKYLIFSVEDRGCLSQIPDPDFYPSRIPDPDAKTATKERVKKFVVIPFFVATNFIKLTIILFLKC